MGGYVAFALWRRRPELVRALVLADTRPDADSAEARENRARMADTARRAGPAAVAGAMLPSLLAGRTMEAQPDVVDAVRDMIATTATETLVAALAGMAARPDSSPDLEGIDVPTLVVVGEHDALTPPGIARSMADRIPRCRLEVLPDAGHVSNLESPGAFTAALKEFLTDL
jgi:3-oxoadipate enol-lactonase